MKKSLCSSRYSAPALEVITIAPRRCIAESYGEQPGRWIYNREYCYGIFDDDDEDF